MSLDVSLTFPTGETTCACGHAHQCAEMREVFSSNITHNLTKMAEAAGIYEYVWRPDEVGITKAHQLIEPLRRGIDTLRSDESRFRALEPTNKWGTYDSFIPWLAEYVEACLAWPDADVSVSR